MKKTGFLCHFLYRKKKKRVQQITLKYSTNSTTLGPLALTLPLQPGKLLRKQPSKALQKDAHTPPDAISYVGTGPFPTPSEIQHVHQQREGCLFRRKPNLARRTSQHRFCPNHLDKTTTNVSVIFQSCTSQSCGKSTNLKYQLTSAKQQYNL